MFTNIIPAARERWVVGLDVHARSISASALDLTTGELINAHLAAETTAVLRFLTGLNGPAAVAYEAGPTGFGLARALDQAGLRCVVAAPSKIARASGDRVKTDKRDATLLARRLAAADLTAVRVPTPTEEAARDLTRAHEDARTDLMSARHRASKLLLRHGIVYSGGRAWTLEHHAWLARIRLPQPASQTAFDDAHQHVLLLEARKKNLAHQVALLAAESEFTGVFHALGCLRGIAGITAMSLAVEIGDWDRFTGASIGAYLGLTPTEHSSGGTRRLGPITKAGNPHARRLLVEAAWHHRPGYRVGTILQARFDAATPTQAARGHEGNLRLHRRWEHFDTEHKRTTVANIAIARELAGWCWSLATTR
ncbi:MULTISPECIES: IS110 family transposase [Georgenia]|uniref:Transposase n=1 Tax=Georgenia muralis TaxID=154117 RepID=A0A3N4Z478_9MICO|nr:IS110 family transposase [Georgenia muralis]RPF28099.1 transposase [Georgenia muralis]